MAMYECHLTRKDVGTYKYAVSANTRFWAAYWLAKELNLEFVDGESYFVSGAWRMYELPDGGSIHVKKCSHGDILTVSH